MDLDRELSTIDLVRFKQWATGNDTRLREIIEIYRQTMTTALAAARTAQKSGDAAGLRRSAHDLKNCFLLVGARQATVCSEKIEELAMHNAVSETAQLVEALEQAAAAVDKAMSALLEPPSA